MNLSITALEVLAPGAAAHEIAERKGRGHPDSLCDALAENLSIGLARFYVERFGAILHHNVDKALLIGGPRVRPSAAASSPSRSRSFSREGRRAGSAASACRWMSSQWN